MDKTEKVILWIILIVVLVVCFFVFKGLLKDYVVTKETEGLWIYFYISAPISFILCLVLMYNLTEEAEWNPYGSAFISALAFPIIITLIALAIMIVLLIGLFYLIAMCFKDRDKGPEGEIEIRYRRRD